MSDHYSLPSDEVTIGIDSLPTGLVGSPTPIGVQVRKASNSTVVLARTESGISESPAGSGNYLLNFIAPAEQDTYTVTADWNAGILEPSTSRTEMLQVTVTLPLEASGLGAIADAAQSHLGVIFNGLRDSDDFGETRIVSIIENVKARVLTSPPATGDEDTLHRLVIDYLGKLVVLELLPSAYAFLADQVQTTTTGDSPAESVTYVDKIKVLEAVEKILLGQVRRDEAAIIDLLPTPKLIGAGVGPLIDEADDCRVTADPRDFPRYEDFPRQRTGASW